MTVYPPYAVRVPLKCLILAQALGFTLRNDAQSASLSVTFQAAPPGPGYENHEVQLPLQAPLEASSCTP